MLSRRGPVSDETALHQDTEPVMNNHHQAIIDAALALPEPERALLTERLLESFSPAIDEVSDEELFAELNRRRAEMARDPSIAIPWSEVAKEE